MKRKTMVMLLPVGAMVGIALGWTAFGQSKAEPQNAAAGRGAWIPLELGQKIQLNTASHPVEWRTNTYHLVTLGSIQFELERNIHRLKAEIQAGTMSFDNVDYDVSVAVFDASGTLLGTARTDCKVERVWLGSVVLSQAKLGLDFGISLDYASASSFMVSISRRNVLTPDQWQK